MNPPPSPHLFVLRPRRRRRRTKWRRLRSFTSSTEICEFQFYIYVFGWPFRGIVFLQCAGCSPDFSLPKWWFWHLCIYGTHWIVIGMRFQIFRRIPINWWSTFPTWIQATCAACVKYLWWKRVCVRAPFMKGAYFMLGTERTVIDMSPVSSTHWGLQLINATLVSGRCSVLTDAQVMLSVKP